jgi:hypothetical protein
LINFVKCLRLFGMVLHITYSNDCSTSHYLIWLLNSYIYSCLLYIYRKLDNIKESIKGISAGGHLQYRGQ